MLQGAELPETKEGEAAKSCGCSGWRTCAKCESTTRRNISSKLTQAAHQERNARVQRLQFGEGSAAVGFSGVGVYADFISPEEEAALVAAIDSNPWKLSQSGRRKQDYGPRANFKKRKVKLAGFNGLPPYALPLAQRVQRLGKDWASFVPAELGCLEYTEDRGACIEPHIDDTWLWGDRFVILSLLCDCVMTFSRSIGGDGSGAKEEQGEGDGKSDGEAGRLTRYEVQVHLPQRSLLIVGGAGRYEWEHGIEREHILYSAHKGAAAACPEGERRRVSLAMRNLASDFFEVPAPTDPSSDAFEHEGAGDPPSSLGAHIVQIASTFSGSPIG